MTSAANTSLAFVSRNAYGDRCFQFYRDPGADMLLRKDEVIAANIAKSKFFILERCLYKYRYKKRQPVMLLSV